MTSFFGHASRTIARVFAGDHGEDGCQNSATARANAFTRHILQSITEALLILEVPGLGDDDAEPRVVSANHAALEMLGWEETEISGAPVSAVLPRFSGLPDLFEEVGRRGSVRHQELEIRRRDGREVPVRVSGSLVTTCEWAGRWESCPKQQEGEAHCPDRAAGIVLILTDITEIRRAELSRSLTWRVSELVHSAESMEDFYRSVHEILAEFMPTENFCVMLRDEGDPNGLSFPCFVDRSGDPSAARAIAKGLADYALRRDEPLLVSGAHILDLLRRRSDRIGEPLPSQWLGVPLTKNGRVTGLMAVSSYRPDARFGEAERELLQYISGQVAMAIERKSESEERARLSSAVEHAADAIIIAGPDGVIQYVNPAFERMSGYTRDEVLGRTPRVLKSGLHGAEFYREIWSTIASGAAWTGRMTNQRRDGTLYEIDAAFSAIRDGDDRVVSYVSVQHDVTHEVALEAQLRQSQKMEAVGKLAGGVAHDFNNILSIIMGYSDLVLDEVENGGVIAMGVEEIREASQRAGALTRQLLTFSRRQIQKPGVICMNSVIEELERMLRRLIGEDIELMTDLDPMLGPVRADPGQIEQVVMNLAVNARDAMPQGGTLSIETGMISLRHGGYAGDPDLDAGDYIQLTVTDTGCGMDAETRTRIFEPFFSTKEDGQGTGLGLSTVYGIVKQSGGHISVSSRPNRGAAFRILLPLVADGELTEEAPEPEPQENRGQETILLVEDEDSVRNLTREMLSLSGYHVLEARDGVEALHVGRTHTDRIDLLLTDVIMPRMGGRELSQRVVRDSPETRVLFMSGYTDAAIAVQDAESLDAMFLQKPFGLAALKEKVREVLDAPPWRAGVS
jgi:PAS domain S-box-containing protein